MVVTLYDLPKISLNKFYSGLHFSKRVKIKDNFKWVVKSQYKGTFKNDNQYNVQYDFEFRIKPLDASNTIGMVKMLEDVLFPDDGWKVIKSITLTSTKGLRDKCTVTVDVIK